MAGITATGVKVVLDADPVGIITGFAKAETAGQKFAASLSGMQNVGKAAFGAINSAITGTFDALDKAAKRVRNMGIGLGVSLAGATYGAIQFEAAMRNVATIDSTVRDGFKQTSATVLNMSRVLPQSAKELAEGYYDIASSGFTGAEGQRVLFESAKAATAGLATTAEAGRAMTSVLNAYGKSSAEAAKISDILFQTVNLGVVNFAELTGVIGDTVGMAAAAKVSFREVGTAIATITLSGISAAEAGTSLNRLLQSLIQPTEELTFAWSKLSNQTIQEAVASRGLKAVMDDLRVASGGNLEVLLSWFDEVRAARGALALMADEGKTYTRVQEDMKEAVGATDRALAQQMQSASMQIKLMFNELKAIGIEIGNRFLPVVTGAAKAVTFFAGAWDILPTPIKTAISWLAAASSAIMTLVGFFGVFVLKAVLMNKGIGLIATGLSSVATRLTAMGGVWARMGTTVGTAADMMANRTRNWMNIFNPIQGLLNRSAGALQNMAIMMNRTGVGTAAAADSLSRWSNGLRRAADLIPKLAISMPVLALGLVALVAAYSNAQKQADLYIQKLEAKIDLSTYAGVQEAIDKMGEAHKRAGERTEQYRGILGALRGGFEQVAHSMLGIVGIDVFGDPMLEAAKFKGTIAELNDLLDRQNNMNLVSTAIWSRLWETNQGVAETYRDMAGHLPMVGKAAKNVGIDLDHVFSAQKELGKLTAAEQEATQRAAGTTSKYFKDHIENLELTKKQVKDVTAEWIKLTNASGGAWVNAQGQAMEVSKKQLDEFQKYVKKTTDSVSEAFYQGFGVVPAIDTENLIPDDMELETSLNKIIQRNTQFVADLDTLLKRGLNPDTLLELGTAGPEAASAAISVLLGQNGQALIDLTNQSVAAMRDLRIKLERETQLIAKAAAKPMFAGELPQAVQIADLTAFLGKGATAEEVAKHMGLDTATVQAIALHFGIDLAASIPPEFEAALGKLTPTTAEIFRRFFGTITASTALTPAQTANLFTTFLTQGKEAAIAALKDLKLPPAEQELVISVLDEMANYGLEQFAKKADDATKPRTAKVDADTKDADTKVQYTHSWLEKVGGWHGHPTITLHSEQADAKLAELEARFGALDRDRDIGIQITERISQVYLNPEWQPAKGMIIQHGMQTFAQGGISERHTAQIVKGWRLWAEPETGGEAYIPLAMGKRPRSMEILDRVAGMFGYNLTPDNLQFAMPIRGEGAYGGSSVTMQTTIVVEGNIYGDDHLRQTMHSVVDRREQHLALEIRKLRVG